MRGQALTLPTSRWTKFSPGYQPTPPRCRRMPISRILSIGMPGMVVSIARPKICCECSATACERARSIALVCRRAVGRNDDDRLGCPGGPVGLPDHVEQPRVHPGLIIVAPIAQEIIEFFENRRIIGAVDAEGRLDRFPRVGMIEVQGAGVAVRDRRFGRGRNDNAGQERRDSRRGKKAGISQGGRAGTRLSQVKSRSSGWAGRASHRFESRVAASIRKRYR